jgi:hypothetical protein
MFTTETPTYPKLQRFLICGKCHVKENDTDVFNYALQMMVTYSHGSTYSI